MKIEQLYFESGTSMLFGALFIPKAQANDTAYIICHPFAEEKKSAQRALVELANAIANDGKIAFMFDFYGCGDSEGTLAEANLDIWKSNIHHAILFLKSKTSVRSITIIGLRLSATLAFLSANESQDVQKVILLEPIPSFVDYLKESLKQKLINELLTGGKIVTSREQLFKDLDESKSIDFDGHEISSKFYRSCVRLDERLRLSATNTSMKVETISISNNEKITKNTQAFINQILKAESRYSQNLKLEPFWNKIDDVDCSVLEQLIIKM